MATIETYTLFRRLRCEGVPLRKSVHLGDGVAAALWERDERADTRYDDPTHHTLSLYVDGGELIRRKVGSAMLRNGGAGSLCVLPHGVTTDWEVEGWIRLFHLYVPPAAFDRAVVEGLDADPARVELIDRTYIRDPLIEGMIRSVVLPLRWEEPADRVALSYAGRMLIAALVSRFTNRDPRGARALGGLAPAIRRRLVEFIDARLDTALTIDELAEEAGLSPFHFARAFKRSMGEPPHRFVQRRRVERAKDLIRDGRMSLAEVALACGFSSQSHFTARFREFTGVTPGTVGRG